MQTAVLRSSAVDAGVADAVRGRRTSVGPLPNLQDPYGRRTAT
jgi:hypothetical protein